MRDGFSRVYICCLFLLGQAMSNTSKDRIVAPRCEKTGNPCGTDTLPAGRSCECLPCREWLRNTFNKRLIERLTSTTNHHEVTPEEHKKMLEVFKKSNEKQPMTKDTERVLQLLKYWSDETGQLPEPPEGTTILTAIEVIESLQARVKELEEEVSQGIEYSAKQSRMISKLNLALEFDNAPDDASWEPPHPIFRMVQDRDDMLKENQILRATIKELEAKQ